MSHAKPKRLEKNVMRGLMDLDDEVDRVGAMLLHFRRELFDVAELHKIAPGSDFLVTGVLHQLSAWIADNYSK